MLRSERDKRLLLQIFRALLLNRGSELRTPCMVGPLLGQLGDGMVWYSAVQKEETLFRTEYYSTIIVSHAMYCPEGGDCRCRCTVCVSHCSPYAL